MIAEDAKLRKWAAAPERTCRREVRSPSHTVAMHEIRIPVAPPFHFRDVVFSHGWLRLPPYQWEDETGLLARTDRLPSGEVVRTELSAVEGGVSVRTDGDPEAAERRARWTLALEEDFGPFHRMCAEVPHLARAAERGQGRILRCPTAWEDLVKTLFSVNTTWRQTIAMTTHLVTHYGERHPDGTPAFPDPAVVARIEPAELQERCRVGYRAAVLSRLARQIDAGELDLESLKGVSLEEAEQRLRAIHGVGPYAAANMLMLLGHYDHLPVDSWFRKTVRDAWFPGEALPDRTLVAAFDRFRPFRTLVYLFYDWEGAMRREVWEGTAG